MKALDLRKIGKPYFGYEDIARVLNISPNSAKVAASRYVKAGILIRIKRNLYVLFENWAVMSLEQKFTIANLIQVPSYISLMTALGYYEITTQLQQDYIESVGVRRTKDITIEKTVFRYTKIKPELYSGFKRMRGFFIAEPEKAFVDALYLQSLGRRSIDTSSLDVDKLDWPMVLQISKSFPKSTRRLVKRYERFGKT
ncbi:MAG: type IV toxin-antitoxin system AbiEi family antitoxin domain-containing protein [Deltaproteobacteria bacterium]|nr:type IV toxin-antitoxin system AbiEi family antitoxin domain-containing protein [Deltaproteobacteria bacterium]